MTCSGFVRGVLVLAAASSVFAAAAGAAVADDQDVIGTWKLSYNSGDGDHKATLTVTKGESGVTGTFVDGQRKFDVTDIKFKDGKLTLATRTERNGEPATATFEGKVTADAIAGSADWTYQGMSGTFSFEGTRDSEKPRALPPSVVAVPGAPSLLLGRYDVAPARLPDRRILHLGSGVIIQALRCGHSRWAIKCRAGGHCALHDTDRRDPAERSEELQRHGRRRVDERERRPRCAR